VQRASPPLTLSGTEAERGFKRAILRLVKGGAERLAIEAGQIDAIIDPASGNAILLPEAQWALNERKAEALARNSNRLARAILDALGTPIVVLDDAGIVLSTNQAWRVFAAAHSGVGAGITQGSNYLAVCESACGSEHVDGVAIAAGIRQVIAGERAVFRYDYAYDSAAGQRWFALSISGIAGDDSARAMVLHEDITERKRGELLLSLEHKVLCSLADAGNATDAVKSVIRAVCETQGWKCGRYFGMDQSAGVLRFSESWGVPVAAVEKFLEESRGLAFRPGAGLAGRAYLSGQPLWVLPSARDAGLSRTALAPETGEGGAFVFPVTSEDAIVGVLAFSNPTIREPDDRMLKSVQSIGRQLGRSLQRLEALDSLRRSESRFRALNRLTCDWYWEQDRDFRFTQIAGCFFSTADSLGMTHWDLPNVVLTDSNWAEHKSHLDARWSFCDFEFTTLQPDGQRAYYSICGEPVYDEFGKFKGYCGTGSDITKRKRVEVALRAELASRAEFALRAELASRAAEVALPAEIASHGSDARLRSLAGTSPE
jgi:PAS domain-containing protein